MSELSSFGYIILGDVPEVKREGLQRLVQGRSHGVLDGGQLCIAEKHCSWLGIHGIVHFAEHVQSA